MLRARYAPKAFTDSLVGKDSSMTEQLKCPRRAETFGPFKLPDFDTWDSDLTCSYCGSLRPDKFMEMVESGVEVIPTDKNYKAYVGNHQKFYFQHLDEVQKNEFIALLNAKAVKIGYPGHFYVAPFFVRFGPPEKK